MRENLFAHVQHGCHVYLFVQHEAWLHSIGKMMLYSLSPVQCPLSYSHSGDVNAQYGLGSLFDLTRCVQHCRLMSRSSSLRLSMNMQHMPRFTRSRGVSGRTGRKARLCCVWSPTRQTELLHERNGTGRESGTRVLIT